MKLHRKWHILFEVVYIAILSYGIYYAISSSPNSADFLQLLIDDKYLRFAFLLFIFFLGAWFKLGQLLENKSKPSEQISQNHEPIDSNGNFYSYHWGQNLLRFLLVWFGWLMLSLILMQILYFYISMEYNVLLWWLAFFLASVISLIHILNLPKEFLIDDTGIVFISMYNEKIYVSNKQILEIIPPNPYARIKVWRIESLAQGGYLLRKKDFKVRRVIVESFFAQEIQQEVRKLLLLKYNLQEGMQSNTLEVNVK